MSEQDRRSKQRLIEQIAEEFARERGLRELRRRDGSLRKEVKTYTGAGDTVEVSAVVAEVSRWLGRSVRGGAWCWWRIGEVEAGAADFRQRLVVLLEQAWSQLDSLDLEDVRREHGAFVADVEHRIDPMLEEYARALGGALVKGRYRDLYHGDLTKRHVEWPSKEPRHRITVGIHPDSGFSADGYAKCERSARKWAEWGGELLLLGVRDLADLAALRALLDRFVRLLRLLRLMDDFAKAHGLGLFFWYPKWMPQEGQGVWLTRRERRVEKYYVSIGLKEEVLTVAAAAQGEKGRPRQPLGTVEVADPELCEKTMGLVEQAWDIVGPRGSKDSGG